VTNSVSDSDRRNGIRRGRKKKLFTKSTRRQTKRVQEIAGTHKETFIRAEKTDHDDDNDDRNRSVGWSVQ
jgi:hypothetical protein